MASSDAQTNDEAERLLELQRYAVLDTPPEPAFDDIALLAATLCDAPVVLLGLIDAERVWFKARRGIDVREVKREGSVCGHALRGSGLLVVPDLHADPRYVDLEALRDHPELRFYAGVQLLSPAGHVLGSLSVMDVRARTLAPGVLDALQALGRQAAGQFEMRRQCQELEQTVVQRTDDLAALHRLQAALAERDAVLQQAQRLARLGSWRWNSVSGDSQWSDETYSLYGVDAASFHVSPATVRPLIHPDDVPILVQAQADALAGVRPYDVKYRIVTPAGELRYLHGRAEVVDDPHLSGTPAIIGTVLDISERVAYEHELARHRDQLERLVEERTRELIKARDAAEQASRAKSEFLSSMSHELRTPMNAILGFAQLLQLERSLGPRASGFVREVLRAGHHLLQLINEVLDLARVESGRLTLSPEPLPLSELAAEALTLVQPLAAQRGVRLDATRLGDAVVHADRLRLKQVLLNLLSNAVKYNRDAGTVELRAETRDGRVRVVVQDTGIGIAPEQMAQLFQPFSRLGNGPGSGERTGIGLSISQRLLQLMGGRIGAQSEPGVGSEFWFDLPCGRLADAPAPRAMPGMPEPPGDVTPATHDADRPSRRQACVLYIEDNPSNLKLVEQIVQRHAGLHLLQAPSGGLGLELARAHQPDLVLLDIHLPDIDGYHVLAQLRADSATRGIAVVAVTAQAMPDDVKRVSAAGFDGYLAKPLDLATVDGLLEQLLARR